MSGCNEQLEELMRKIHNNNIAVMAGHPIPHPEIYNVSPEKEYTFMERELHEDEVCFPPTKRQPSPHETKVKHGQD